VLRSTQSTALGRESCRRRPLEGVPALLTVASDGVLATGLAVANLPPCRTHRSSPSDLDDGRSSRMDQRAGDLTRGRSRRGGGDVVSVSEEGFFGALVILGRLWARPSGLAA